MWPIIVDVALPLVGLFLVGAFGWWVLHWIAEPILDVRRIRRDVHEALHLYGQVAPDWKDEKINEAADGLRRLAARIASAEATSWWLLRWYHRNVRQWRLDNATTALRGMSNVMSNSMDERIIARHDVEAALRLPFRDSPERISRIRQKIEKED